MPAKPRTVLGCWMIARRAAEVYQRAANRARRGGAHHVLCIAKRDAADRIALTIRHGSGRNVGKRSKPRTR